MGAPRVAQALDDSTDKNGALCFLRGSHRVMAARPDPYQPATPPTPTASGTPMQQASVGVGDLLKSFPALQELEDVSVPVRAGDCIVVRIFRPQLFRHR